MIKLTNEQGEILLKIARDAIADRLRLDHEVAADTDPALDKVGGTFVTLKKDGQLRGCIGTIEPLTSLRQGVRDNAINAAFRDHRFTPLTPQEYGEVELSVSVLTPAAKLTYSDGADLLAKLRPGVDGVILRHGGRSATFLPQVWEQLEDTDLFLSHLCLKAGLPADFWESGEAEVLTYQVQSFSEKIR